MFLRTVVNIKKRQGFLLCRFIFKERFVHWLIVYYYYEILLLHKPCLRNHRYYFTGFRCCSGSRERKYVQGHHSVHDRAINWNVIFWSNGRDANHSIQ
jgi:hypothetical protein